MNLHIKCCDDWAILKTSISKHCIASDSTSRVSLFVSISYPHTWNTVTIAGLRQQYVMRVLVNYSWKAHDYDDKKNISHVAMSHLVASYIFHCSSPTNAICSLSGKHTASSYNLACASYKQSNQQCQHADYKIAHITWKSLLILRCSSIFRRYLWIRNIIQIVTACWWFEVAMKLQKNLYGWYLFILKKM